MIHLIKTSVGRLRIVGLLEGVSLLILVFVAMPLKYLFDSPAMTKAVGSVHGALFLLFVFQTIVVAIKYDWKFTRVTWKVLLASMIPFGTFYIDKQILSRMADRITH